MKSNIQITYPASNLIPFEINQPYYFVFLIDGEMTLSINFNVFQIAGKTLLFIAPYQLLKIQNISTLQSIKMLQFHGDFYCIEYHKEEVACNGILFNNIYEKPFFSVSDDLFREISAVFPQIESIQSATNSYDVAVVRTYLQLILALSSREKQLQNTDKVTTERDDLRFDTVLEQYFKTEKTVAFYADYFHLSIDVFSKKVKKIYGKSPSKLIQERMILEAKKQIHLTYKSIKEIANDLGFEDEFYFSRYFKREVGVSPKLFRGQVGISIVAKKDSE